MMLSIIIAVWGILLLSAVAMSIIALSFAVKLSRKMTHFDQELTTLYSEKYTDKKIAKLEGELAALRSPKAKAE